MDLSFQRRSLAIAMLAALLATPATEAGLAYISQERRVEAPVPYLDLLETKGADGFGPFDESVGIEAFNEFGDRYVSRATQSSALGDRSVQAAGAFAAASGGGSVGYRSLLAVTFDVAAATPYAVDAVVDLDLEHHGGQHPTGDLLTVLLRRVAPGEAAFLVERRVSEFEIVNGFQPPDFATRGMLAPGRYELTLEIQAAEFVAGGEAGTYRFDFRAGDTAVPLPPAAWMGLLTLGGIAGSRLWVIRRARAAVAN